MKFRASWLKSWVKQQSLSKGVPGTEGWRVHLYNLPWVSPKDSFGARNADKRSGKYKATLAHQKCTNRHSNKPKKIRFTEAVRQQTEDLLKQDYSPEQVCPRDSFGVESSEPLIRIPCQQKGYISTSGRIKNEDEPFSGTWDIEVKDIEKEDS